MRIVFVNPSMSDERSAGAMEPLAFGVLKALTPADVETVLFDERVESVDFDTPCDAVAVSTQSFTARRSYQIAAEYRKRGIPVILGGHHPTLLPDEAAEHCDAVAVGPAEETWPRIVADLKVGSLRPRYEWTDCPPVDVTPDRKIFAGKRYASLTPVQAGWGCRFSCDFCSVHVMYRGAMHQRPVEQVLQEVDGLESRNLMFVDDNILLNRRHTGELLAGLRERKKRWVCQISIDAAYDDELIDAMAAAGCMAVFVGLESMDAANLEQIGKQSNLRYNDYQRAVERFRKRGIMFCGSFVFGYDSDSEETIRQAYEFAQEAKLCLAHFNTLRPMPGTRLYDRLEREGRLRFKRWWLDPEFRYGEAMFYPENIDAAALGPLCYEMRRQFNTLPSILHRLGDARANALNLSHAAAFLGANLVSRREIKRKQHAYLGGKTMNRGTR